MFSYADLFYIAYINKTVNLWKCQIRFKRIISSKEIFLFKAWLKSRASKEFSLPLFLWPALVVFMLSVCATERNLVSSRTSQYFQLKTKCSLFFSALNCALYYICLCHLMLLCFISNYATRGQWPVWTRWYVRKKFYIFINVN